MTISDLKTGDVIKFSVVPYGSYADTTSTFRVERRGKDKWLRLVDVRTGASTYDPLVAFRGARFDILPAA